MTSDLKKENLVGDPNGKGGSGDTRRYLDNREWIKRAVSNYGDGWRDLVIAIVSQYSHVDRKPIIDWLGLVDKLVDAPTQLFGDQVGVPKHLWERVIRALRHGAEFAWPPPARTFMLEDFAEGCRALLADIESEVR